MMSSTSRLEPIPPEQLTPEQRRLYDDILSHLGESLDDKNSFVTRNEEKAFVGPWNGWLHAPVVGAGVWTLIKAMAQDEKLPQNLRQIAILTVGSHFNAAYEIYAHTALARQSFDEDQIRALTNGAIPQGFSPEETLVHQIAKALVRGGPLSDELWAEGVRVLGQDEAIRLVFLVGLYALVSMCLNGFNVPVPAEA